MAQVHLLLLFVFLTNILCYDGDQRDESTGCPKRLGRNCICGLANYRAWAPNRQVYITNCTNTGFTDASIIEAIPTETEVLIMTGNKFNRLPWNLLGIWDDHDKLEVIDLTNNQIQEIQGKSFHKVNAVKRLILDHNDLYIVPDRVCDLFPNLLDIYLGDNQLTEINFSLDCLERFRYLDVSFNKIRNLKTLVRDKID